MSVAQDTQRDIYMLEVFEQAFRGAREKATAEGLDWPFSLPNPDPLSIPERWENMEKHLTSMEKWAKDLAQVFRS